MVSLLSTSEKKVDVLVFDLRPKLAHFRQPDTLVTQATYPVPPRPTILGLLASILGISLDTQAGEKFLSQRHFIGISVLKPIRTVCVQMSMLGKGFLKGQGTFNRLTTIELIVSPHYRIFYAGDVLPLLNEKIRNRQSVYHTYLGCAYCLVFPEWIACYQATPIVPKNWTRVASAIPMEIIEEINLNTVKVHDPMLLWRARALPYTHNGKRVFSGTVNLIYQTGQEEMEVRFNEEPPLPFLLVSIGDGKNICLW